MNENDAGIIKKSKRPFALLSNRVFRMAGNLSETKPIFPAITIEYFHSGHIEGRKQKETFCINIYFSQKRKAVVLVNTGIQKMA